MQVNSHINDCLLWQDNRATATFKKVPEDFIVNEILDWNFSGQGEHIFLYIEKTACNTAWLARQLARFYNVPPRDVGYSGLKDRHAVTRQYFSVRLPGVKAGRYDVPEHDEYRVISHVLHHKKLKRGNHQYNDFSIRLREVSGDSDLIEERLAFIRDNGCPNVFDSQRFGHNNNNLLRLAAWVNGEIELRKRDEKSLVLSALRAAVFNRQLAERVQNDTWQQVLPGDRVILDGSHSHFIPECIDDDINRRAIDKDIHPAGILVGAESDFCEKSQALTTLMHREHLKAAYRPLRLRVQNLSWQHDGSDCVISMRLPSGGYASGVIKQAPRHFRLST